MICFLTMRENMVLIFRKVGLGAIVPITSWKVARPTLKVVVVRDMCELLRGMWKISPASLLISSHLPDSLFADSRLSSLLSVATLSYVSASAARWGDCSIPLQANFATLPKTKCADKASEDHPSGARPETSSITNQKCGRCAFVRIYRVLCH